MPIVYDKLFQLLKDNGYTTYKIRQDKLIGQATLTALKNGTGGLDHKTIARICEKLDCQPADSLISHKFLRLSCGLIHRFRSSVRLMLPDRLTYPDGFCMWCSRCLLRVEIIYRILLALKSPLSHDTDYIRIYTQSQVYKINKQPALNFVHNVN